MSEEKQETKVDESFKEIFQRLQEIADQVQDEDASLETSIDLLEEAVKLGTKATDLIDDERLSDEEKARLQEMVNGEVEKDQELVGEKVDEAGLEKEAQEGEELGEAGDVPETENSYDTGYVSSEDIAQHEAEIDAGDGKWSPDA